MFKRILKWTGIAFGLFAIYMLVQLFWPSGPIKVSPQTTVITQPLADDGLPDYSKYLLDQMRDGVTPENNGAVPFLQAMWPAGLEAEEQSVVCSEMEIEIPQEHGLCKPQDDRLLQEAITEWLSERYPGEEQFYARREYADELLNYAQASPWQQSDIPQLADWLELHRREFDLLHEAAECHKFYLPSPTLLSDPKSPLFIMSLPHELKLTDGLRCLSVRAHYYIAAGDSAAAWNDCRTMYQLADKPQMHWMVSALTSSGCESLANQVATKLMACESLTPEVAKEIRDFLAKRSFRNSMRSCINDGERLLFVTLVLELSGQRTPLEPTLSHFVAKNLSEN